MLFCPVSQISNNVRPFFTLLCGTVGRVSTTTTATAWSPTWRKTTRPWSTSSATSPTSRGVCPRVSWGRETSQASSTDRYNHHRMVILDNAQQKICKYLFDLQHGSNQSLDTAGNNRGSGYQRSKYHTTSETQADRRKRYHTEWISDQCP